MALYKGGSVCVFVCEEDRKKTFSCLSVWVAKKYQDSCVICTDHLCR